MLKEKSPHYFNLRAFKNKLVHIMAVIQSYFCILVIDWNLK